MKKFELIKLIKRRIFEKNPIKGGTPAIEKRTTVNKKTKYVLYLKSANA